MTVYAISIHNPWSGLSFPFKVPDTSSSQWWDLKEGTPHRLLVFADESDALAFCAARQADPGFTETGLRYVYEPTEQLIEPRESAAIRAGRQHDAKARVKNVMGMRKGHR